MGTFADQHCSAVDSNLICREISQRLSLKKSSCMWHLVILLFIGLCGIYLCSSDTERQVFTNKLPMPMAMSRNSSHNFFCRKSFFHARRAVWVHFPQPLTFNRRECRCMPVHYFAIFTMQRSGSGWFEALLNSHPNVSSYGEIFSVDKRRKNWAAIKKNLDKVYNLDWLNSSAKNECTAAAGLKWMLNQGLMEYRREIAGYLEEHKVSVIFLFRRNILKRYISILANSFDIGAKQLNGSHQSHVHSIEEANVLAMFKPIVNLTSLIPYLQRIEEIMNDAIVSFNHVRHIVVQYEDLVKHPKELERAQMFLGVESRNLESKQVKIHTLPLHDQVGNWKDLSEHLRGTKYDFFLEGKE